MSIATTRRDQTGTPCSASHGPSPRRGHSLGQLCSTALDDDAGTSGHPGTEGGGGRPRRQWAFRMEDLKAAHGHHRWMPEQRQTGRLRLVGQRRADLEPKSHTTGRRLSDRAESGGVPQSLCHEGGCDRRPALRGPADDGVGASVGTAKQRPRTHFPTGCARCRGQLSRLEHGWSGVHHLRPRHRCRFGRRCMRERGGAVVRRRRKYSPAPISQARLLDTAHVPGPRTSDRASLQNRTC
jgi:hypothetical protein